MSVSNMSTALFRMRRFHSLGLLAFVTVLACYTFYTFLSINVEIGTRQPEQAFLEGFKLPKFLDIHREPESSSNFTSSPSETIDFSASSTPTSTRLSVSAATTIPECFTLPGASDVVVVLKTGASEIYKKLPIHFDTLLRCVPNYIIVSDLEQDVGEHHVVDILAEYGPHIKDNIDEFQHYKQQQQYTLEGKDISKLKGDRAWNLDKWKNIPSVRLALKRHPQAKWFVCIDADSALMWSNLLLYLERMDPNQEIYSGAVNYIGDLPFAHGGSGILVSRGAALRLEESYPGHKKKWEEDTKGTCCGDGMLASAFRDIGINVQSAFPIIQGEAPMILDWNDAHMCWPSVTWHHCAPHDVDRLWRLQTQWWERKGYTTPFLYRDIFPGYVNEYIEHRRDDWDNISRDYIYTPATNTSENWAKYTDTEKQSTESFDTCKKACDENQKCLQWKWRTNECQLAENIRVGEPWDPELKKKWGEQNLETYTSGWLVERIRTYHKSFDNCEVRWG